MKRSGLAAAKQTRSRETAARLLDAAEQVLQARGLEGASVPEIARKAGVSAASIYRRFADKEGLLREVFERFFQEAIATNEAALQLEHWEGRSLDEVVSVLVRGMVAGCQQRPGLLRAVIAYGETHPSATLRRRAIELREKSLAAMERILLARRDEIAHPDPARAVYFALHLAALVLREHVRPAGDVQSERAFTVEELAPELTRLILAYLRASDPAAGARARKRRR